MLIQKQKEILDLVKAERFTEITVSDPLIMGIARSPGIPKTHKVILLENVFAGDYALAMRRAVYFKYSVALLLIPRAGNVNLPSRSQNGKTALHLAAANGYIEAIEALIANGAYVNILDDLNMTPLFCADLSNQFAVAICLLQHGADVTFFPGTDGKNFGSFAEYCQHLFREYDAETIHLYTTLLRSASEARQLLPDFEASEHKWILGEDSRIFALSPVVYDEFTDTEKDMVLRFLTHYKIGHASVYDLIALTQQYNNITLLHRKITLMFGAMSSTSFPIMIRATESELVVMREIITRLCELSSLLNNFNIQVVFRRTTISEGYFFKITCAPDTTLNMPPGLVFTRNVRNEYLITRESLVNFLEQTREAAATFASINMAPSQNF